MYWYFPTRCARRPDRDITGPRKSEVVGVAGAVARLRSCARSAPWLPAPLRGSNPSVGSPPDALRRATCAHSLRPPRPGPAHKERTTAPERSARSPGTLVPRDRSALRPAAMARAPRSTRRRRDAAGGGEAVRKGHWTAEEDAVLREHVRAHGPQDWSSIRSKGLLPRTGKSCRLRWVNKLRPDLKTGCRLSAEEKRVVLELQAQFGNKWARIATYLPGRTDNDVKNFWSTRQKRIARLMATPLPGRSSRSSARAKAPAVSSLDSSRPATVVPCLDQVPFEGSSSGAHACSAAPSSFMDAQNDAALVLYDRAGSRLLSFGDGALPLVALGSDVSYACSSASASNAAALPPVPPPPPPPPPPFDQPLCPLLDFPGIPEAWSMAPGFAFANAGGALDDLAYHDLLPVTQSAPMMLPFFGTEFAQDGVGVKAEPPDAPDFFGDLPPDMLDSFDQLPPPLSPPATSSGF